MQLEYYFLSDAFIFDVHYFHHGQKAPPNFELSHLLSRGVPISQCAKSDSFFGEDYVSVMLASPGPGSIARNPPIALQWLATFADE